MRKFRGKYRGIVVNNDDPLQIGRLKAQVPDVLGEESSSSALPCAPFAGPASGFFCLPVVGAQVWVEFEQGDPEYPIWTGGFWAVAGEVPPVNPTPGLQTIVLQSVGGNTLLISDSPDPGGGILLKSSTGASIRVNGDGIVIDNGQGATIVLAGPGVSVNDGALAVV
jgi:uncharacterized protein involved in type VI secretion and phage assembly